MTCRCTRRAAVVAFARSVAAVVLSRWAAAPVAFTLEPSASEPGVLTYGLSAVVLRTAV
jgi:hypothetical protein